MARLASAVLLVLAAALENAAATTACSFTLAGVSASLTQSGTASAGGVQPEAPVTVAIVPVAGAICSGVYTAASSSPWLSATTSPNSFTYTALTNPQPSARGAALTIANLSGGSATFTVIEAGDPEVLLNRQVRALYQSVLGRDPDPAGFTFWTGLGSAGLGQMLDSFLTSPEAFNSDFAVMAVYQAVKGAAPTYAQFMAAAANVRSGNDTIGALFNSLLPNSIAPTYTVQNLYQNLLQRAPVSSEISSANAVGLASWFQTLIGYPSNTAPVSVPNNEFMSTGTFATGADHTNALYIAMLYYAILGRDYDPAGYSFWLGIANHGGPGLLFQGLAGYPTRIQIVGPGTPNQGFAGSPEFQGLFQAPSNPVPAIASLSPPSAGVGAAPFPLTIGGSGFTASSTATFNGVSHQVTFVSPGLLTITLSGADLAAAGSFPIVVANPAPGGGTSLAAAFLVQSNNPLPSITSLSPSSSLESVGPFTLTVNGSGFIASTTATFNGVSHAVSLVSANRLTITVSAADISTAGSLPVVVANPAPGGGSSSAAFFTVQPDNPVPAITGLLPFFTHVAPGPLTVTINGSGFISSSQATYNGVSHTVTFLGANQLAIALSTADLSAVGIFPVVVTNPPPGGGSSPESPFTVQPNNPVPAITTLSPPSAQVGSGPLTLTIDGSGFLPDSTATFAGTPHTLSFLSPSQLTMALSTADLSTVGGFAVVVTNPAPGGGSSPAANFTVQPTITVPAITGLSPPSAQAGAGPLTLTVSGTGFTASSSATFNGISHTVTILNANQLTITLSPPDLATVGSFPVVIANPGPSGGNSPAATFLVQPNNPSPSITSLSPAVAASGAAGFTLTVTGSNFVPASAIQWNGSAGQPPLATSFVSPAQLTVTIPAADVAFAGTATVTVVNPAPGGGSSAPASFTVTGTVPANVSFVAPNGNDSNPGTIGQPYLTVQRCATTVAAGGTCALRAGTYYETVTPNSGITIASYDGEPVTIDGTNAVTGWTLYQGSIYKAGAVLSTGDTNQVFVGAQMMTEARWPNGNDLFNVNWATAQAGTTGSLLVDPNLPDINWTGAAIHLWSGNDAWGHMTGTVTGSSPQQLTMNVPTDWCPSLCPMPGGYYYLSGTLAALDTQQEWFYDPIANLLYFWAPGGVNPNTLSVRAKQRQMGLDLSGRSNVTIRNINLFATSIDTDPSSTGNVLEGIDVQYVSHFTTLPPPAEWDSHLTDSGIIMNGSGNTLQDSAIAYSAGNGIALMGSNNSVRNSLIHHTGYMGTYASGINMFGPGDVIRNDTIHTSGRFQVYLNSSVAPNDNDQISFSNLFDGMILTLDGGEIYTTTDTTGVQIHDNWIHDTWPSSVPAPGESPHSGVYLDQDAGGYSVYQNILWNNQYGNIFLHGAELTAPNNNSVYDNSIPDENFLAFIWLQDIPNCGTTQVSNNLVLVTVNQVNDQPPCPAANNSSTAPGATDLNSTVQVGCNFAGCASSGPPAISGSSVAASIAIQPFNAAVAAGQPATFNVTAASSAAIAYQWQRNGVNIGGATAATYTTPPTTSADNGAVFTVQVNNSVGGVTSNPAILTVN